MSVYPTKQDFSRAFRDECVEGSAIALPLYLEAIDIVADIEIAPGNEPSTPIHDALGWQYTRFTAQAKPDLFAALFKQESGEVWQAKLSDPIPDKEKEGKFRKYESPAGQGSRAYFPPVPPEIRELIGQRYEVEVPTKGSFWLWATNTALPVIITEGGKKALALLSHGFIAIALYGCNGGYRSTDDQGNKIDPYLIPDLRPFLTIDRLIYLAFDRDLKKDVQQRVGRAIARFGQLIEGQGCKCRVVLWEPWQGKGIDDLIYGHGIEALETAIKDALPLSKKALAVEDSEAKKSITERILEIAESARYFHDQADNGFADIYRDGHRETYALKSRAFINWLAWEMWSRHGKAANGGSLSDALVALEAKAQFEGSLREVHTRVAEHEGRYYIDLGNDDWTAVEISPEGWRITTEYPVRFIRSQNQYPLPLPVSGGKVQELEEVLNLRPEDCQLLYTWLAFCLCPHHPHPLIIFHGEAGSGKSNAARVTKGLVDPCKSPLLPEPRETRDLAVNASHRWVMAFDNLSHISAELSDAFCRISTGGGFSTRSLFTNADECVFEFLRPMILTGIDALANRGDLLERAILINLPVIPADQRLTEGELQERLKRISPRVLGALLDATVIALQRLPEVKLDILPRMADFARWAVAIEEALGYPPGSFMERYHGNREEAAEVEMDGSPIAVAIVDLMADKSIWEGSPSELLDDLEHLADEKTVKSRRWPQNPSGLGKAMIRIAPLLRSHGIHYEKARKSRRLVQLRKLPSIASIASIASQGEPPTIDGKNMLPSIDGSFPSIDGNENFPSIVEPSQGIPIDAIDTIDGKNPTPPRKSPEKGDRVTIDATATWFKAGSAALPWQKITKKQREAASIKVSSIEDSALFQELIAGGIVISISRDGQRVKVRNQSTGRTSVFNVENVWVLQSELN